MRAMNTILMGLSLGVFLAAPWVAEAGGFGGHGGGRGGGHARAGGYHGGHVRMARPAPARMYSFDRTIVMPSRRIDTERAPGLRVRRSDWVANSYRPLRYQHGGYSQGWRHGQWGNGNYMVRNDYRAPAHGVTNRPTNMGGPWYRTGYGEAHRGGVKGNFAYSNGSAAAALF